jgi:CRISPR-associated protein Cas1
MTDIPGTQKPELQELPQIKERLSFLYVEHCVINRQDGAITITDIRGTVHVPAASLGVIMFGPGTKVSHRAMELIGDTGTSAVWVGERGVRYYAHGRPLTHSSQLLIAQANLVSNVRTHAAVARKMYAMRFPKEDVSQLTIQQLRGREGSRIRAVYRKASALNGVAWDGREYNADDFEASTPVNAALSAAHACLYGIVHSVIVALGVSPGLGFVHTGHERSFVYDIADLYKADLTIPIAFGITAKFAAKSASEPNAVNESYINEIGSATRQAVRDAITDGHIMERIAKDIHDLLQNVEGEASETLETDTLYLWDDKSGTVPNAVSYGKEFDDDENNYGELLTEGYGNVETEQTE